MVELTGKRTYEPDWKKPPPARKPIREVDRTMTTRACLEWRTCPCGQPSATGHHILARGAPYFGDDVLSNILPLCGSGTTGCHGDIENEDMETRKMVGRHIRAERPDIVTYVQEKLGKRKGDDFLRRRFYAARSKGLG